jgi:hypothetical protein
MGLLSNLSEMCLLPNSPIARCTCSRPSGYSKGGNGFLPSQQPRNQRKGKQNHFPGAAVMRKRQLWHGM